MNRKSYSLRPEAGHTGSLSVALGFSLIAGTCLISRSSGFVTDLPVHEVRRPLPGLRLMAGLDYSHLQIGRSVHMKVELKNEGTSQVSIWGSGRCSPALQLAIWGASDTVVWAQGLPLCLELNQHGPPVTPLLPGSLVSATQCFALVADTVDHPTHCILIELPSGTYQVGGSFHGISLPRLGLTVVR